MKLTRSIRREVAVLQIEGDLIGEDHGPQVVEAAVQALHENIRTCVLDISQLRYINSSGIGVFITILTKFRNKGGEVYLMNPSDRIKKLLAVTKLNAIFHTVASADEAAEAINK